MKYMSIFATILFIWLAVILIALTRNDSNDVFHLYLAAMFSTLVLFIIGFAKK